LPPQASVEAPIVEIHFHPSPVSTLLLSKPDVSCTPEPVLSLPPQLITQTEEQQFTEGEHNPLYHNQGSILLPQQVNLLRPVIGSQAFCVFTFKDGNENAAAY